MNVAVLGGGLTGLTAAWKLSGAGHSVRLFESGPRLGGAVRTEIADGWVADAGPVSLREESPQLRGMLGELGLDAERTVSHTASMNRYVALNGRLVALPNSASPVEFMKTPLLPAAAKLKVAAERAFRPLVRNGDVSVAEFIRDHFGSVALERIGQPLVSGIWAGDAERLSLRHAFPLAWEAERTTGSLLRALADRGKKRREEGGSPPPPVVSFRRGMQALPDALASRLPPGSVVLNAEVRAIGPGAGARWSVRWTGPQAGQSGEFDWVLAAIAGRGLSRLEIGPKGARPLSGLADIDYPPVASVFLGYRRDRVDHPLDGFGALVPAAEKRSILGVIFTSSLFPGRAPEGHVALTALVGGALNPGIAGIAAEKLTDLVCDDLEFLLGTRGRPVFMRQTLWPRGIPQYNLGFGRHLEAMAQCEQGNPGLLIGGSVRDGISVPECVASGVSLAERVS
jgi:oxygen-dependent protoporphyrinogen oxidase